MKYFYLFIFYIKYIFLYKIKKMESFFYPSPPIIPSHIFKGTLGRESKILPLLK
jgi:hypothetical protein